MKLKNLQEINLIDLTSEKLIHVLSYIELNLRNNIIIFIFFFYNFLRKYLDYFGLLFNFILIKVINKIYRKTSDDILYRLIQIHKKKKRNQFCYLMDFLIYCEFYKLNIKSTI